jgi:hypothetical protein
MATTKTPSDPTEQPDAEASGIRVELWAFLIMVTLALVGAGITELEHSGGRLYWLFLVLAYAGISIALAWRRHHKDPGHSLWPVIRRQVLHWLGALVAINIILFFESVDIASRGAAADYSVLVLALSCYLAGIHINWAYLPLSLILAVMAVGLGYLDQLSLFGVLIPIALIAAWLVAKRRFGDTAGS